MNKHNKSGRSKEANKVTLSVDIVTLCCKIDDLLDELARIESEIDGFNKWIYDDPLAQLDDHIGEMFDKNSDTVGPVMMYYVVIRPSKKEN